VKRISALFVAVALASLLSACGGGKHNASVKAKNGSKDASGKTTGNSSSAQGATPTTTKGGKTSPTTAKPGTNGPTTTTTTKPHRPIVMKLDKTCVRRGATGDLQGLTIQTDPNDIVAWSTEYSDHSNELTHPEWQKVGGSGSGKSDANGNFHTTWHVPDDAPLGTATLHTIAEQKLGPVLTFKVVSQIETCP
jgi:hypothetical protein